MASIFNALHIGYSGLNASQVGINVTGHNISNAETEGYTRQRVVQSAAQPITIHPGDVGNGAQVDQIVRVFDAFVYDRYTKTSEDKAYSDFSRETLETLSTYFPEIDDVGIKSDLHTYFDMWQSLADNPDNNAVKVALAQQAQVISNHIHQTREQVYDLQQQLNGQLATSIDEVNRLASEIADLNRAIANSELANQNNANDLRDQRNQLELALTKLVGSDVFGGETVSDMTVDRHVIDREMHYNIHIGGFNVVDGVTFHPIGITNEFNPEGFHELYYEQQDGQRIPFDYQISGGKVGAIMDLRGSSLDATTGIPEDGTLQDVINQLDAFAAALIEGTNNVYAQSATSKMESNPQSINPTDPLVSLDMHVNEGDFDIIVYDIDGNETARRTVTIGQTTSMNDVVTQLTDIVDDNADGNLTNDIDSLLNVSFLANGVLTIELANQSSGLTFAIEDQTVSGFSTGTNFAGALGLHRFFDGSDGKNIDLKNEFKIDPSLINGFSVPQEGNNSVAQDMVQLQFEKVKVHNGFTVTNDTLYGYFDTTATFVGSTTNTAIVQNDALTAQFNAIELEYASISKVSIDEEMTNLIKYQTAYGAAAKVITTIDQMMDTLLGIKR
jgi:flagellar hook-associated protein 1 FlgK